jgi:PKHD-type hydroxylase
LTNAVTAQELGHIKQFMACSTFVDGKTTAGWHARLVKHNLQVENTAIETVRTLVEQALRRHELFSLAAKPRHISPILFSKYVEGMHYGAHVDDAFMGDLRSDLSFTLFLADPAEYEGGELVMDLPQGEQAFKLNAGDLILYPSTTLHRVDPVLRGERRAAIGWVQSRIRSAEQREILFDLEQARLSLFQREGKSLDFDLLSKSISNLLRMWGE